MQNGIDDYTLGTIAVLELCISLLVLFGVLWMMFLPYGANGTKGPKQPRLAFGILSGVNGHVFHGLSQQDVYHNK